MRHNTTKQITTFILTLLMIVSVFISNTHQALASNESWGIGFTGNFMHFAHNVEENKDYPAYCLDRHAEDSKRNPTYDYTMIELPSSNHYQIVRYIAPFVYGNNTTSELEDLFGYSIGENEADRATQFAIWAIQEIADGNYSSIDKTLDAFSKVEDYEKYLDDGNSRQLVKAMVEAGLDMQKNGIHINSTQLKQISSDDSSITYQATITTTNAYGGYTGTLTGLPSSATIKSKSSNLTITNNKLSSSTKSGTDTFEITIPYTSAGDFTITTSLSTRFKTYPDNKAVLFADSDDDEVQNFLITHPNDLQPTTSNTTSKITVALPSGYLQVSKTVPSGYNASGAQYTVYTDAAATTKASDVSISTIASNGKSNIVEVPMNGASSRTLYVKETKVPTSSGDQFKWEMNDTVYKVTVTNDATESKPVIINTEDKVTEYGYTMLKKVSANPSITDGNACYSLKDAVYTIYTDKACKTVKTTITTKADGTTDAIKLETGTYYVKETTASKGYALDDEIHTVTVTVNNTSAKPAVINSTERPLNDPNVISVKKQIQN